MTADEEAGAEGGERPDPTSRIAPGARLSPGAWAGALTAAVLLGCIAYGALLLPLSFNTNDDAAMLGISLGIFSDGLGDPRLVYQSAFVGALVGTLFRLFPGFDWYSAFQWSVCLAAFGCIAWVLLRRDRSAIGALVVAAVASIYLPPILFHLQFTQSSFLCLAASLVLLIDAGGDARPRPAPFAAAFAFATLSVLLRSVNLTSAQLLLGIVAVGLAARWTLVGQGRVALRWGAVVGAFALVLTAATVGLQQAEGALFYGDPAWHRFWDHHADRAFVLDNWPRWIGLPRIAMAFQQELGISPQQLVAMLHWLPIHEDLYSVERFGEMAAVIRGLEAEAGLAPERTGPALAEFGRFVLEHPVFAHSLGLIAVVAALHAARRPTLRWAPLAIGGVWIAVACGLLLGVTLAFRLPPYRVWMPLVMLCVLCSLASQLAFAPSDASSRPAADDEPPKSGRVLDRRGGLLASVFVVALLTLTPLHRDFLRRASEAETLQAQKCALTEAHVRAFSRLPENARIFLAPQIVHADCYLRPFRNDYPEILRERAISFGWRNLTPWVREELFAEHAGLFDAVCSDPGNMFVLHPFDWKDVEQYLRRHEPGIVLETWAPDLPPAILACRRGAAPLEGERLIGAR